MIQILAIGCVVIGITAIVQSYLALAGKSKKPASRGSAIAGVVLGVILIVTGCVLPLIASRV